MDVDVDVDADVDVDVDACARACAPAHGLSVAVAVWAGGAKQHYDVHVCPGWRTAMFFGEHETARAAGAREEASKNGTGWMSTTPSDRDVDIWG